MSGYGRAEVLGPLQNGPQQTGCTLDNWRHVPCPPAFHLTKEARTCMLSHPSLPCLRWLRCAALRLRRPPPAQVSVAGSHDVAAVLLHALADAVVGVRALVRARQPLNARVLHG